jgi:hypothetical protein
MVLIAHIGVWTPHVNDQTEAALRMIRHVDEVTKFSEGFMLGFERPGNRHKRLKPLVTRQRN